MCKLVLNPVENIVWLECLHGKLHSSQCITLPLHGCSLCLSVCLSLSNTHFLRLTFSKLCVVSQMTWIIWVIAEGWVIIHLFEFEESCICTISNTSLFSPSPSVSVVNGSVYKGYVPSGERCQCPSGLITLQGGHCADHRGTHSPPGLYTCNTPVCVCVCMSSF